MFSRNYLHLAVKCLCHSGICCEAGHGWEWGEVFIGSCHESQVTDLLDGGDHAVLDAPGRT